MISLFRNMISETKHWINKICNLTIIDSGKNSMTGGRLKKIKKFLKEDETFMFTYGDGVSNINIKKIINFNKKNKKMI